jgi:cell wall-associated NlpC family hydrolase
MQGRQQENRPVGPVPRAWRRTGWLLAGGVLVGAAAVGVPAQARAAGPPPPGPAAGSSPAASAAGQVSGREAALSAARVQLAAASARLASLRTQAEVTTEQYDKTMVNLHQAQAAYRDAMTRYGRATRAEAASRRRVAALAAQDYEAGGGFGTLAAMLGDGGGPQAYAEGADVEQQLAQQGDDVLSHSQAAAVVAGVFRSQAQRELAAERSAVRQAATLKTAIVASVARQQAAVRAIGASTKQLETELGAAQAREYELAQAGQRSAAARQDRQQALAAQHAAAGNPVTTAPAAGGYTYGTWPSSYSLAQGASAEQGNIAANWALSQLGKPYQWGGAGPNSYDCSGLTMDAWAHAGVTLLHWTGYQWPSGPHIPIDQLRRGDLLFYATNTANPATIHHVGIYIGNGEMVDAPYTGADVRIDSIYQPGGLIGATRPAA